MRQWTLCLSGASGSTGLNVLLWDMPRGGKVRKEVGGLDGQRRGEGSVRGRCSLRKVWQIRPLADPRARTSHRESPVSQDWACLRALARQVPGWQHESRSSALGPWTSYPPTLSRARPAWACPLTPPPGFQRQRSRGGETLTDVSVASSSLPPHTYVLRFGGQARLGECWG